MPDNSGEPEAGDGLVTLPHDHPEPEENETMAADLPPTVAQLMMTESTANIQADNRQGRGMFTMANGSMQAGVATRTNEVGPIESRAVSGVLATPVASPTTQSGQ